MVPSLKEESTRVAFLVSRFLFISISFFVSCSFCLWYLLFVSVSFYVLFISFFLFLFFSIYSSCMFLSLSLYQFMSVFPLFLCIFSFFLSPSLPLSFYFFLYFSFSLPLSRASLHREEFSFSACTVVLVVGLARFLGRTPTWGVSHDGAQVTDTWNSSLLKNLKISRQYLF